MLNHLKKPHGIMAVLVVLFALAWAIWTFVLLPASEMPSNPDPATALPPGTTNK